MKMIFVANDTANCSKCRRMGGRMSFDSLGRCPKCQPKKRTPRSAPPAK